MASIVQRLFRLVRAVIAVGAAISAFKWIRGRRPKVTGEASWPTLAEEAADHGAPIRTPQPVADTADTSASSSAAAAWVEPTDGACPASHPVKGNRDSGIYHVPGGASYERTVPEVCYVSPEAAEADGFRRAKR